MMGGVEKIHEKVMEMRSQQFSRLKDQVYVDHAGASQYPDQVLENYTKDLTSTLYGNPHSGSVGSQSTQDIIDKLRISILQHFNTNVQEYSVIFTSGATASMKLLSDTFQFNDEIKNNRSQPNHKFQQKGCFYFLDDNHTSVIGMREMAREHGAQIKCLSEQELENILQTKPELPSGNNLFAFPAQSNFCGRRYPLAWIKGIHSLSGNQGKCLVFLDAAGFASSCRLDLGIYKPDFVAVSFYKMFGFPTGLGALLVRSSVESLMTKTYFGGGTLQVAVPGENFHVLKKSLSERFEDGTVNYLAAVALKHALQVHNDLLATLGEVNDFTFFITRIAYSYLSGRCHANAKPIAICYTDKVSAFEDHTEQGPIIAFNMLGKDGDIVGYTEVARLATLYNVHLRTGCFCNLGDCQKHLGLSSDMVKQHFQEGHVCGDGVDVIDGTPTGAVRISFGYYSSLDDVKAFIAFVEDCFVEGGRMDAGAIEKYIQGTIEMLNFNYGISSEMIQKCDEHETRDMPNKSTKEIENGLVNVDLTSLDSSSEGRSGICIEKIYVYPVKSCGAFVTPSWELGPKGLLYDREWMIVDETGTGIRQAKFPQMTLITPNIDRNSGVLRLEYPGLLPITTPLETPTPPPSSQVKYFSRVCSDTVESWVCGADVSNWFCLALGVSGLHLVRQSQTQVRKCLKNNSQVVDNANPGNVSLANEAQYLLISRSSIKAFLEHMKRQVDLGEIDSDHVPEEENLLDRFRANFLMSGEIQAYAEDQWKSLCIRDNVFNVRGKCKRCQVICTDQKSGVKNKEIYKSLSVMRKRKATFGILINNAGNYENIPVSIGDRVSVLEAED